MKKMMALLLALTMLFGATAAMAEEVTVAQATAEYDVTLTLPEGYTMQEDRDNNMIALSIDPANETDASYYICIAPSEEYAGLTLNELSDDEKTLLQDMYDEDFAKPEAHSLTTEHGTEVYLFNETAEDAENSFAEGFTIYKGYFINIYAYRLDGAKLEQADLDTAMKILSDMWFVE